MEKNTGKVREFCQSGKVGTMCNIFYNHRLALVPLIMELDIPFKIRIWVIFSNLDTF